MQSSIEDEYKSGSALVFPLIPSYLQFAMISMNKSEQKENGQETPLMLSSPSYERGSSRLWPFSPGLIGKFKEHSNLKQPASTKLDDRIGARATCKWERRP